MHNILAYLGATGNCDIVLPSGVRLVTLLSADSMRSEITVIMIENYLEISNYVSEFKWKTLN